MKNYDDIDFNQVITPGRNKFTEYSFSNVFNYIVMIITLLLQVGFLVSDVYTLIQIYALNNWDSMHVIAYVPILVYRIVFTVCIGFSFIYLFIVWGIGIKVFRSSKVTKSYLTETARYIDSIQSFEKFCLFQNITATDKFEWLALTVYQGFHYSFYGWLIADTPRQLLNGATIASSISNNFSNGNIGQTIEAIASKDNKTEAVLLSFMLFSFLIWIIFAAKYIFIIFSAIYVTKRLKRENPNYKSLSFHCAKFVSDSIYDLVEKVPEKSSSSLRDNSISSSSFTGSLEKPLPSYKSFNNSTTSLLKNPFDKTSETTLEKKPTNPFIFGNGDVTQDSLIEGNQRQQQQQQQFPSIPLPKQASQLNTRNGSITNHTTNNDDPFAPPRQRMDSLPLSIQSQRIPTYDTTTAAPTTRKNSNNTLQQNEFYFNKSNQSLPRFSTNNTLDQIHATPPLPPLAAPETDQYRLHKQHSNQSLNSRYNQSLYSKRQPPLQQQHFNHPSRLNTKEYEENPFAEDLNTTVVKQQTIPTDRVYEYHNKRESNPFAEEDSYAPRTDSKKDQTIISVSSYSTNSSESYNDLPNNHTNHY